MTSSRTADIHDNAPLLEKTEMANDRIDRFLDVQDSERECLWDWVLRCDPTVLGTCLCDRYARLDTPEQKRILFTLARRLGTGIHLNELQRSGWMQNLSEDEQSFRLVIDIVGRRYLAYSILLGIQITQLNRDPVSTANTIVHFTTEEQNEQMLPLGQFQSQVTAAVLTLWQDGTTSWTTPITIEDALLMIGEIPFFVAPLFNLRPLRLVVGTKSTPIIDVAIDDADNQFTCRLDEFAALLRERLKADLIEARNSQLRLDLSKIDDARAAFENREMSRVITALESWPGILSAMLRTPAADALTEKQLQVVVDGLAILSQAYWHTDRRDWAMELLRLGIQYGRDLPQSGPLFFELGKMLNEMKRFGEAIGYLRRAMILGHPPREVYPPLALALLSRNKVVAARLLALDAQRRGVTSQTVDTVLQKTQQKMTERKLTWPT